MAITHDLIGSDEDLARRILVRTRDVAPCVLGFDKESEDGKNALAILKGVYARAAVVGTGAVASKGRNGTSISYRDIKSAFSLDDLDGLRSLCSASPSTVPGLPRGSFPKDRPLANTWPEGSYT